MKKLVLLSFISACFLLMTVEASAQTRFPVRFPAGTHGTTIRGTVRGFAYRDYVVRASGGQTIRVTLKGSDDETFFWMTAPNGKEIEEASETNTYTGELPSSGNYVVRVMMHRLSARRKGSFSNFTLKISIR